MRKTRILFVEDDQLYAVGVRLFLERKGFTVTTVKSEVDAPREFRLATHTAFSLVLVGISRPTRATVNLIYELREIHWFVPIIILSEANNKKFIEACFLAGADDFQPRNISQEILLLKIRVFQKRSSPRFVGQSNTYKLGNLMFDTQKRLLVNEYLGFQKVIRKQEAKVLSYLAIYAGRTVLKKELQRNIWGNDTDYFMSRALDVHIRKLRVLLNGKSGITLDILPNVGYSLTVDRESSGNGLQS